MKAPRFILLAISLAGFLLAPVHAESDVPEAAPAASQSPDEPKHEIGIVGLKICGKEFRAIADVLPDTPAEKAGLNQNDYILAVEGKSTTNMKFADLLTALRGKPGTIVTITVRRVATQKVEDFSLTRIGIMVSEPPQPSQTPILLAP